MKNFVIVPASEGSAARVQDHLGLPAGYGSSGRIYGLGKAVRTHSATARMNGGPVIDPNSDEPTKPSPI